MFQTCLGSEPLFEVDRVWGGGTAETLLVLPQSTGEVP